MGRKFLEAGPMGATTEVKFKFRFLLRPWAPNIERRIRSRPHPPAAEARPEGGSPAECPCVGRRPTYFPGVRTPVILLVLKVSVADILAAWKFQEKKTGFYMRKVVTYGKDNY